MDASDEKERDSLAVNESAPSYDALFARCNRQAELLRHVRNVILPFNPKHYFIEQEKLLTEGMDSYWSELMGLRRLRDSHEKTISEQESVMRKQRDRIHELEQKIQTVAAGPAT